MKKRAQITMETLLLYGVAILIVLLAIAALTYFGVLDLGGLLPERCNLESTGIFKCEDFAVSSSTDNISIIVMNTGTKQVTMTAASFVGEGATTCTTSSFSSASVAPGGTSTITITCSDILTQEGDKISGEIAIDHKFTTSGLNKQTTGSLRSTVSG